MLYNKDWAYKLNPVADTLLKAADLLEKHGHIKFVRGNKLTGMCFLGALEVAQGHPEGYNDSDNPDTGITMAASRAVAMSLGLEVKFVHEYSYGSAMAGWNNKTERTGQEVIDAMRLTASKLLEKENTHAV